MIVSTTPIHRFNLPFSTSEITKLVIAYNQGGCNILEKTEDDCTLTENTVSVQLTQEETLLFNYHYDVEIQIKVLTTDNNALASKIIPVDCEKCLINEVL